MQRQQWSPLKRRTWHVGMAFTSVTSVAFKEGADAAMLRESSIVGVIKEGADSFTVADAAGMPQDSSTVAPISMR